MKRLFARLLTSGLDGRLEAFSLEPGDRILYTSEIPLTIDAAQSIQRMLEAAFPGHVAVIVSGGGDVAVLRAIDGATREQVKEQIERMAV